MLIQVHRGGATQAFYEKVSFDKFFDILSFFTIQFRLCERNIPFIMKCHH